MADPARVLWWVFLATFIAVVVLVGGLGIAMARSQRRVIALHREYLRRLVSAHEEERSRVAREVHDDAVQRLVYLGRELDISLQEAPAGQRAQLSGLRREVDTLADRLRDLAHRLHPAALEHVGLNAALRQLAEETERLHPLSVELALPAAEYEMDQESKLALFRITQEALRNAVRHARADSVRIMLARGDGALALVVEDTGQGFDERALRRPGIGLVGIRERARLVGGDAEIQSAPGGGTRVTVRVPIAPPPG